MTPPPVGIAFTAPEDGDMRHDLPARRTVARRLGIPLEWATASQVHGGEVTMVSRAGPAGPSDGLVTDVPGLPLAVFTADCLGVVLAGPGVVGVSHAGWRGLAAGVIEATSRAMTDLGGAPGRAVIGPSIGPCCFEVGPEVTELFPEDVAVTSWGTPSVDLRGAARRRLGSVEVVESERCTACGGGPSHRRHATARRMAALGWVAG